MQHTLKSASPAFSKRSVYYLVMFVLCAGCFFINYKACYPGFLSQDTLIQYEEVLSNTYTTWHPPIMAYTWHLLNSISPGPQLMLVLQLLFLWISCYLFAISFRKYWWGIAVIAFFVWAPFIHNFSGWIVKDTQMALSWLLATAIMFKAATSPDRRMGWFAALMAALLIIYGTWMRYNAVTALPPLCIAWAWLAFRGKGLGVKIAMTVVLLFVTVFGHNFFNFKVLNARKDYTDFQIYFHDIAGVYVRSGKDYFPPAVKQMPDFDTAYIKAHYSPINVTKLLWNEDGKTFVYPDSQTNHQLRTAWLDMIKKEPGDYLDLRWDIYKTFLGIKKGEPSQYFYIWISSNRHGFKIEERPLYFKFVDKVWGREDKIYFQVWFWILLNIVLFPLVFLVRHRIMKLVFVCFAASGFLYTLPQFVVANTTRDFRYIYWACFACIVSIMVLLADRLLMRREPEGEIKK